MARTPNYSFLLHITLAAFVSGATIGFLRPDFPAELTAATTRIFSTVFVAPAAPVIAPAPQETEPGELLPSPLLPVPAAPRVLPRPPAEPPESEVTQPAETAPRTLPPIDLEIRVG
jgi:hypothetical protein